MHTPPGRLLFVGNPDAAEISHWTAVRAMAVQRGWETTRTYIPGRVTCAVASENVLDGICSSTEASVTSLLQAADIRVFSADDAMNSLFTTGEPIRQVSV
ncbi:hypothetical protein [Rhodococcus chondri]|uniref:Uncharacterized protein n=1 Tax=Rhodococcus chondri TaxID=3065941 RepID=A0ABU7JRM3_9NOCA|nr:hypothetical protein [Rhodococcus sp. CC-R104]MEE2031962.1 hypothetical protein [Rhodococcus sp. CC-R104]